MKKSLFIMSMAAALAVLFSACAREEMEGPEQLASEEGVLTSFVFNISTAANQTKQSSSNAQADGSTFHGIVDAKLLSYALPADGSILIEDATADKLDDLSALAAEESINTSKSRRILEMQLPLKTNTVLLYGRGQKPTTGTGGFTPDNCFGKLEAYTVTKEKGSANFQLARRLQDADDENFFTTEKLLAGLLTVIMNTHLKGTNHTAIVGTTTAGDGKYVFDVATTEYPDISWADYITTTNSPVETGHELYPLEQKLSYVYRQMTNIRSGDNELRAGSGEAIRRMVADMWSVVNSIRCGTPISKAEAVAKLMAVRIDAEIDKYFNASIKPQDGSAVSGVDYDDLSNIVTAFGSDSYYPTSGNAASYKPSAGDLTNLENAGKSLKQFPFDFDMPSGVSYLEFVTADKYFRYPQDFNTSEVGGAPSAGGAYNAYSYYYPAEILYFGNSPIRVSNLDHKHADYPENTTDWAKESKWPTKDDKNQDDWVGTHVTSATRSVAMKYDINYGVSMLETKVGYSATVLYNGFLYDNNHAVQKNGNGSISDDTFGPGESNPGEYKEEPDNKIFIKDGSFKLTGVMIGGQPQNVGWDFLPIKDPTEKKKIQGFIFDKAVHNQSIPFSDGTNKSVVSESTATFTPNYTVVFDNYNSEKAENQQDVVYVALEFQNCTDQDFFGNCNIVPKDGYFYLIAALDPKLTFAEGKDIVWPTSGHVIPPYNSDGTSKKVKRVFVQDFMTSATFKFGPKSLQYAYVTMPDLRSSSLTLGLSVDIKWEHGLEYEEVILGGQ